MSKLPPANLPPNAMPWAREMERRLSAAQTQVRGVSVNVGSFGQAVVETNNRAAVVGAALTEAEAKLTNLDEVQLPALDTALNDLNTVKLPQLDADLLAASNAIGTINTTTIPGVISWANRVATMNSNVIIDPYVTNATLWDLPDASWSIDMTMNRNGVGGALKRTGTPTTSSVLLTRANQPNVTLQTSVTEGEVWEISGWAYLDDAFNGTTSNSKLRVADQTNALRTAPVAPLSFRNQWREVKSRYTVPAGVTTLRATIVADNTEGTVWWTDFSFRNVTGLAEGQIARNEITTLNTVTIPQLNTDLATERGRITELSGSLGTLSTDLSTAKGQLNTLTTTTIPQLNTDLATERQRITDNKTAVDSAISTANTNIGTAQGQLNTLNNTTIPNLNNNLAAQGIKVDSAAALAATKGRIWSQAATPPSGTTYQWVGAANSTMSTKTVDGVEVARNMHLNPGGNGSTGFTSYSGSAGNVATDTTQSVTWSKSGFARRKTWTTVVVNNGDIGAIVRHALDAVPVATSITAVVSWRVNTAGSIGPIAAYSGSGGIVQVSRNRTTDINAVPGVTYTDWVTLRSTNSEPRTYDGNTRAVIGPKPQAAGAWIELSDIDIYAGEYDPTRQWFYGDSPDDRAYDLWIDETGGANTPKRWNGTTWVSAQDKAASDANNLVQAWKVTGKTTIDGGKIEADSVTAGQIATNAITANELAANAVYAGAIQADAVTANAIKAGEITASKMVTGTITAASGILADAVITSAKIADLAVTNAKVNDLSAAKITAGFLASDRIAANSLDASKITAGTITTDRMTANTINGDRILTNTLNADKIVAGSITTDRMTANSINGDRIATNTLNANRIVAGSIMTENMLADSINGDRIAANTLSATKIIARSITSDRIGANQVTANEIAANTITANEIKAGEITATALAADAITGKTITGSSIVGGTITGTIVDSIQYLGEGIEITSPDGLEQHMGLRDTGLTWTSDWTDGKVNYDMARVTVSTMDSFARGVMTLSAFDKANNRNRFIQIGGTTNGVQYDLAASESWLDKVTSSQIKTTQIDLGSGYGMVTARQFYALAYPAVNQTITSPNTWTRVTLNNSTSDPIPVSNSRITIPAGASGVYRITADLVAQPTNSNTWRDIHIRVNGVIVNGTTRGASMGPSGAAALCSLSVPIPLVAGDYVELWTQGSASAGTTVIQALTTGLTVSREQF